MRFLTEESRNSIYFDEVCGQWIVKVMRETFKEFMMELFDYVRNDKQANDSVVFAVRHLISTVNLVTMRTAKILSKENEETDNYHDVADVQFPDDVRDETILDLVKYYLSEMKTNND